MLHTQVHVHHVRPRSTKDGHTARSAPTKQIVGNLFPAFVQPYSDEALACAMCGKANSKSTAAAPVIAGQKFTLK